MTLKEHLYQLIEELPEHEAVAAVRYLEYLRDREADLPKSLRSAPLDEEPVTPEELAALAEAEEDFAAGRVVSHDEIRREFTG